MYVGESEIMQSAFDAHRFGDVLTSKVNGEADLLPNLTLKVLQS